MAKRKKKGRKSKMKQSIIDKKEFQCDNCRHRKICKGIETFRLVKTLCKEANNKSDCDFILAEAKCEQY